MVRQLALLVGLAGAVAAGISLWMWGSKPGMTPLYSSMAPADSAAVADALRASNIPFQIDAGTGAVSVPGAQLMEARMKLAGQGLPKSASQGFETIAGDQGFGTSQFIEGARYQHALEIELGRTIASLQSIRNARVHLALPKASAFASGRENASASVLVELAPGRQLEESQSQSIVSLVASSVPDLSPSSVTVIDQYGRSLTRHDAAGSASALRAGQLEEQRRIEADYVHRIETLLTPLTGPGRVSAQVTADLDFTETEEASESYKPDPAAIRSEQSSEDNNKLSSPQGVPGAASNQPAGSGGTTAPPAVTAAAESGASSRHSVKNYELGKTLSHTRKPGGAIRRLSVAVLVDFLPKADDKKNVVATALTADEMKQVDALVREAVGFNADRGDSVSVQNAPFMVPELAPQEATPIWQRSDVRDWARTALGAGTVLILIFAVLRPVLRQLMQPIRVMTLPAPALEGAAAGGGGVSASVMPGMPAAASGSARAALAYEDKLTQARGAVTADPKRVAQVVKTWVGEDNG